MGQSDDLELQALLRGLFLSMYLIAVLGNLQIILAVSSDSHLHTPMYFFLSNLSLTKIGFTTIVNIIVNIQTHSRVISYGGCLTQMSIFMLFGCMDDLLTAMAYDWIVAICNPLHYLVIMNPQLSGLFSDHSLLFNLASFQILTSNMFIYSTCTIFDGVPPLGIIFSYYKIICSILRVPSTGEKYKALSTCGSHLSVS
ncbi:olfactory receptor 7E178-like [Rhynchonycteris naso]